MNKRNLIIGGAVVLVPVLAIGPTLSAEQRR